MVTNFVRKVAQISCLVLGYFEKHHFLIKTVIATFEEFGLLFITTSAHTGHSLAMSRSLYKIFRFLIEDAGLP